MQLSHPPSLCAKRLPPIIQDEKARMERNTLRMLYARAARCRTSVEDAKELEASNADICNTQVEKMLPPPPVAFATYRFPWKIMRYKSSIYREMLTRTAPNALSHPPMLLVTPQCS